MSTTGSDAPSNGPANPLTDTGSGVLRTKDIETVLNQADDEDAAHPGLSKRLKARDLMGFGVGIVIGTGIFTLTGVEAKNHAGPAIVVSFAIAGVVSMLAALCYAEQIGRAHV